MRLRRHRGRGSGRGTGRPSLRPEGPQHVSPWTAIFVSDWPIRVCSCLLRPLRGLAVFVRYVTQGVAPRRCRGALPWADLFKALRAGDFDSKRCVTEKSSCGRELPCCHVEAKSNSESKMPTSSASNRRQQVSQGRAPRQRRPGSARELNSRPRKGRHKNRRGGRIGDRPPLVSISQPSQVRYHLISAPSTSNSPSGISALKSK